MRMAVMVLAMMLAATAAPAQESTSYRIKMPALNSGGDPMGPPPASGSYRLSPDAIGEGMVSGAATSASYRMTGGLLSIPPPREVMNLVFNNAVTLAWDAEPLAAHYHLYRTGAIGAVTGVPPVGDCSQPDLAALMASEAAAPPVGRAFFYFVNAVNCNRIEGPAGAIGARCD